MMGIKITKDGYSIIITTLIITIAFGVAAFAYDMKTMEFLFYVFLVLTIFNLNFFRDPDKIDSSKENEIISTAQGTVVQIKELEHDDFIDGPATQVSIFLSVFNIHVNSQPISGVIKLFKIQKGKMLAAFNHLASEENEQSIVGIESKFGRLVHKQITGLIARRIICRVEEGQEVTKGERYGMIRFGSRCDIILPQGTAIHVNVGDKVDRGKTVIGAFRG
jgi:phosphatidylserine decarboxylase